MTLWGETPILPKYKIMTNYEKTVKILEGPWEKANFPQGKENTKDVLSRKIVTTYVQDGYLCEMTSIREYRGEDYHDTKSNKRIIKLDG